MSSKRPKSQDYESISSSVKKPTEQPTGDIAPTRPSPQRPENVSVPPSEVNNLHSRQPVPTLEARPLADRSTEFISEPAINYHHVSETTEPSSNRKEKKARKDRELLSDDRWLVRNGHFFTYIGLYLFSILVLFRPYELIPGLGFLSATAFYFALVTIVIYIPAQLATEGNLTMFSTEVKAIFALTVIAIITIPIAKDPALAFEKFNDPYIKAVLIFIILINVVRTRKRLMGLMWLSIGIAVYLSFAALEMYMKGNFNVEDYRVGVNVGGMFGNPNEMAMHLVMMTPLVITLGMAAKSALLRYSYFIIAILFIGANMVTFSRGGFLGLLACGAVMAWKLGRRHRLNVSIASIVIGGIIILAAPGNYGLRMLSIFVPGLDPVGSSDQRRELLERSLLVTARNPWGIGIGNFPIVGIRNLQSHNAFTQVSAELGILGLIAYLVFMISPFRKLSAIERTLYEKQEANWFYYLAIGLQASIIGYMVSSFFASVAYNWFIYYLIAYAVAFRRIYSLENGLTEDVKARPLWDRVPAGAR